MATYIPDYMNYGMHRYLNTGGTNLTSGGMQRNMMGMHIPKKIHFENKYMLEDIPINGIGHIPQNDIL